MAGDQKNAAPRPVGLFQRRHAGADEGFIADAGLQILRRIKLDQRAAHVGRNGAGHPPDLGLGQVGHDQRKIVAHAGPKTRDRRDHRGHEPRAQVAPQVEGDKTKHPQNGPNDAVAEPIAHPAQAL